MAGIPNINQILKTPFIIYKLATFSSRQMLFEEEEVYQNKEAEELAN